MNRLRKAANILRHVAEAMAAAMLVVMFVCFILQIVFRYLINYPLGWTQEVSSLMWVWGILWGAAFVLKERDEVRFDIIYSAVSARTRAVFTVMAGAAFVVLIAAAMPATIDYVRFMRVERSAYLGVRMDVLYSIYLIFALAAIVRYAVLIVRALRGKGADAGAGGESAP